METKKSDRIMFAIFAFALAAIYDVFLWGNEPGLGLALFILLYVVGFLGLNMSMKNLKTGWALLLLVPIAIMSLDIVGLNNELVQSAVPIFILVLLVVFSVLVTLKNPWKYKFSFEKIPVVRNIFLVFNKLKDVKTDLFEFKGGGRLDIWKKILKGIAISIPVLLLFGFLFANADAVFAEWVERILDFEINFTLVWRVIRTFAIAFILSGFFYVLINENHKLGEKVNSAMKLDKITTITVLALINVLFLLFVFVQVQYLFGNAEFVTQTGTTFAEYARSGFFELVWVIIFASLILGIVYKSFSHHGESKVVKMLQIILVAQVAVIAISALKRMNLYQEIYGYTVLRLYVEWFIYLLLTLMLVGVGSLIAGFEFKKYFYTSLVIALIALTTVSSVNVDYLIAKQNIQRFIEGETFDLDTDYLGKLSIDAVAAFEMFKEAKLSEDKKGDVMYLLNSKLSRLKSTNSDSDNAEAETKLKALKEYFKK